MFRRKMKVKIHIKMNQFNFSEFEKYIVEFQKLKKKYPHTVFSIEVS